MDHRITEVIQRTQDLTDQRAPQMGERGALRHSHTTFTTESALLIASTTQRICALADTVPVSTLGPALPIVTTARRVAPPSSGLSHHQHVYNSLPAVPNTPSSTIDLCPLSPHLQNLPLTHSPSILTRIPPATLRRQEPSSRQKL